MNALDDLRMGMGFAVRGGREGWIRTALTAIGVGLGVTLLLVTAAIPNALAARDERGFARGESAGRVDAPGPDTLLIGAVETEFHEQAVRGRLVQPEGPRAPVPPGLTALPKPGELAVSPALKALLDSDEGELLRERLGGRITALVEDAGLLGPNELTYYRGTDRLAPSATEVSRINAFRGSSKQGLDTTLLLLVVVALVVLLVPVAVLIAAAVRFGGDRRDRRLAALRLVGADARSTRRIAAGEALAGAFGGLMVGSALFFLARSQSALITLESISVFPADLAPAPWLVALICLAVPVAAVLVTLLTMRSVVIEPLGVVRTVRPRRRRIWWRLLLPLGGLALLLPQMRAGTGGGNFDQAPVIAGTALTLTGVTAVLPWLVETVVARLGKGLVAWQLAVRRLQMSSGTASRAVNAIAVAVAGAIALQLLFGETSDRYSKDTDTVASRSDMWVQVEAGSPAAARIRTLKERLAAIRGADLTLHLSHVSVGDTPTAPQKTTLLTVGDCTSLRKIATLPSCRDGDSFQTGSGDLAGIAAGQRVFLDPKLEKASGRAVPWTLPSGAASKQARLKPQRDLSGGILATPGALPAMAGTALSHSLDLMVDPAVPDTAERIRNAATAVDPFVRAEGMVEVEVDSRFSRIRRALLAGATCVLLLIGASLLISQLEQLRERRRLLATLVAVGVRRSTLGWSVLWQSALPVLLGLLLAVVVGNGLGAVLLRMTGMPVNFDWGTTAAMTGIGAAAVLLVTALSMPALWHLMRPEGLRTE